MNTKQPQTIVTKVVLTHMMMLTKLNINSCEVAFSGTELIANNIPIMVSLKELEISRNLLTDESVKYY